MVEADIHDANIWNGMSTDEKTDRISPIINSLKWVEEVDGSTIKYPRFSENTEEVVLLMRFVEEVIKTGFTHPTIIEDGLFGD